MANPEHIEILKQGVAIWNKWREANPNIKPDLKGATLSKEDLRDVDFHETDLEKAELLWANLVGANFVGANLLNARLGWAELQKADFSHSHAINTSFNGSDLPGATFCGANLRYADFDRADLRGATFNLANLSKATLRRANLESDAWFGTASLCEADLKEADLKEANLYQAKLSKADLRGANLEGANLTNVEFQVANLSGCNLIGSSLLGTNFSNAVLTNCNLYGTSRDGWKIDNVVCEYIYYSWGRSTRIPKDRNFDSGEFEKLYTSLPTIEYFFENGMSPIDPLIMDRVVQAIRENKTEFDLKIDSINVRGITPSIKFTISRDKYKQAALEDVTTIYKDKITELESALNCERERVDQFIIHLINNPKKIINIYQPTGPVLIDSTVNIEQYNNNCSKLQSIIEEQPKTSKSFSRIAKDEAIEIIRDASRDIAKGLLTEAAKKVVGLGAQLGTWFVKTAAFAFFKSQLGG